MLGVMEDQRRVYVDSAAAEQAHCVYLLDEVLKVKKIGQISSDICKIVTASICEDSYQATSDLITETIGQNLSKQGVWNLVQQLGERQEVVIDRHTELAKENRGAGKIETKLLYEENDGVWLHLQGKSREVCGASKEMKVGIAYDGVIRTGGKDDKSRCILDNKEQTVRARVITYQYNCNLLLQLTI